MAGKNAPGAAGKRHGRVRQVLSWSKAPADTLRSFIALFTDNGCAVLFGRTMDGGALMYNVLCQDNRYKEYITAYADIIPAFQDTLEEALDANAPDELSIPPA